VAAGTRMEGNAMTRQHYTALGAVIVGWVFCRLLGFKVIDVIGAVGGHHRAADVTIGAVLAAAPFLVLTVFTVVRLGHWHVTHHPVASHPAVRAVLVAAWALAGAVMGLLPYSRLGTATDLMRKEVATAPGFLHGLDVTILVGLFATVGLLLVVVHRRADHDRPAADWIADQLEEH
jgi:hypothetical protein